mgnify:CR=1 FL=1
MEKNNEQEKLKLVYSEIQFLDLVKIKTKLPFECKLIIDDVYH